MQFGIKLQLHDYENSQIQLLCPSFHNYIQISLQLMPSLDRRTGIEAL